MEKIIFNNAVRSVSSDITEEDIISTEVELSIKFPRSFTDFYKFVNGGYFVKNCWKTGDDIVYIVGQILPIKFPIATSSMTLENSFNLLKSRGLLPNNLIPFAVDLGGNYFCISVENEVIYWLDHEISFTDDHNDAPVFIAPNMKSFVEGLLLEEDVEDLL